MSDSQGEAVLRKRIVDDLCVVRLQISVSVDGCVCVTFYFISDIRGFCGFSDVVLGKK